MPSGAAGRKSYTNHRQLVQTAVRQVDSSLRWWTTAVLPYTSAVAGMVASPLLCTYTTGTTLMTTGTTLARYYMHTLLLLCTPRVI